MTDISIQNIIKGFEVGVNVLDGVTFDITEGEHVGLLGKNGAGKTTLFKIICGELEADEGDVIVPRGKRIGLISQIPEYPAGYTAEDVLKSAHERVFAMRRRMNELELLMAQNASAELLREYDALSAEFTRLDGYETDRLRDTVANGLGIPRAMREQEFDSLSGGERTRINLARLILEDTDILLLDEPTNHLDMAASEWLEQYLSKFRGTVLVISHDRCFLDNAVTRIIELTDGKAEFYSGAYSFYVAEKQRRYEEKLRKYEKDQAKIAQLTQAADKLHLWAFMGGISVITADHGNADKMKEPDGQAHTAHTTNPVPFVITGVDLKLKSGRLCDITPTMLDLMGIEKPEEMTGESLIV